MTVMLKCVVCKTLKHEDEYNPSRRRIYPSMAATRCNSCWSAIKKHRGHPLNGRVHMRMKIAYDVKRVPQSERVKPLDALGVESLDEYEAYLGEIGPTDQIDHIIPIKCYNLHDPVDRMRAFNYENTRIVSKAENNSKRGSLPRTDELNELRHLWPNSWGVA